MKSSDKSLKSLLFLPLLLIPTQLHADDLPQFMWTGTINNVVRTIHPTAPGQVLVMPTGLNNWQCTLGNLSYQGSGMSQNFQCSTDNFETEVGTSLYCGPDNRQDSAYLALVNIKNIQENGTVFYHGLCKWGVGSAQKNTQVTPELNRQL